MPFRGRGNRVIVGGGRSRRPMDWECGELHTDVTQVCVCQWLIPPSEICDWYMDFMLMSTMVWLALFVPL